MDKNGSKNVQIINTNAYIPINQPIRYIYISQIKH